MTTAVVERATAPACVHLGGNRWLIEAMDTVFSLTGPDLSSRPGIGAVVAAIAADFAQIEAKLSVFRPDSEICRWRAGGLAEERLSRPVRQVIAACDWLEQATAGAFSARRLGGYDPTGFVKGWALARAARLLDNAGVESYCLNGGGDIIARGTAGHGGPWRVGLAHPYESGVLATVVTAVPGDRGAFAVATSGVSQRGQHLADPRDGWAPARSAVSVVGSNIALVDAIATAALVSGRAGPDESARLVRRFDLEAFGFGESGRPWWTPGMVRYALLPTTV